MSKKTRQEQRLTNGIVQGLKPIIRSEVDRGVAAICAALKTPAHSVRYAHTQQEVVKLLAEACRRKGMPGAAFSLRTIQRMESGVLAPRAGYSASLRLSTAALFSWMNAYIAEESARLDPRRSVRYDESLLAHQNPLA